MEITIPNGRLLITQVELKATADSGGYTEPAHVAYVHFLFVPSGNNGTQIKCITGS
jgi:hypothetical protein